MDNDNITENELDDIPECKCQVKMTKNAQLKCTV